MGISDDINSKKAYKRGKSRFEMEKNTMGKFKPESDSLSLTSYSK